MPPVPFDSAACAAKWKKLKCSQLKEKLEELNWSAAGLKAVLDQRLVDHEEGE